MALVTSREDRAKSLINGLSDFWHLYFKEIDQLEAFYAGAEILVGQTYLDMLALLLNSSVQDMPLFNKVYNQLIQISEGDLEYRKGSTASKDRYIYSLGDTAAVPHLDNLVLNADKVLDEGVDYDVVERTLEFYRNPLNAYYKRTFGSGITEITFTSRIVPGDNIRLSFADVGTAITVSVTGYEITVSYDGPANTSTTTAADIVQAVNAHVQASGFLVAELTGLSTGTGSPVGFATAALLPAVVAPLQGYATRDEDTLYAYQLQDPQRTAWATQDQVRPGDVVRFMGGPTVVTSVEATVNTVREDALYLEKNKAAAFEGAAYTDYVVLRKSQNAVSTNEPLVNSGLTVQSGADASIDALARTMTSVTAAFTAVNVGDLLDLNYQGVFRIFKVNSATEVELEATTLSTDINVQWALISTTPTALQGTAGGLTDQGDGTAVFTDATATFTPEAVGTVLKAVVGGVLQHYEIAAYTAPTTLAVLTPTPITEAGLVWGWSKTKAPASSLVFCAPFAWITKGTLQVSAKRLLDAAAVTEGRDYAVDYDTGVLTPVTVWQASVENTATYEYSLAVVENSTPLTTGLQGTLLVGTDTVFSDPTASFSATAVGTVIQITGSGLAGYSNNGEYQIESVQGPTQVTLTLSRLASAVVEPSNGALAWATYARATVTTENVTTIAKVISFWAPNALEDRNHLYNTYGYLINRFENSSEAYRSLIRGIFQLFLLGPTLERIESAINTVVGFPVIRTEGELLLGYDSHDLQSGADGTISTTQVFTSPTAAFTDAAVGQYVVVGAVQYAVLALVSSTQLQLSAEAVEVTTAAPWVLNSDGLQVVSTSAQDYELLRTLPIKETLKDTAQIGVLSLRAFETIAEVFTVTDYVETPQWYSRAVIPDALWPGQSAARRQASPTLFENVVGPADDGRVGDPGFYVGADSEGVVPPEVLIRSGIDGVLIGDPLFPASNDVRFTSATAAFTAADLGNQVIIGTQKYPIIEVVSATEVKLSAFLEVVSDVALAWGIWTLVLPKRHKAAFVIFDTALKTHFYSVSFDTAIFGAVDPSALVDLQELVFAASPAYTYVAFTPASTFSEAINIAETFAVTPVFTLGGAAATIQANQNVLKVDGSWKVGSWYRYKRVASIFAAPAASVVNPFGPPDPGYTHKVTGVYIDPSAFTTGAPAKPIPVADVVLGSSGVSGTGLSVAPVSDGSDLTFPSAVLVDADLLTYVTITGSGLGNNGTYRVGAIAGAVVTVENTLVAEAGLAWSLASAGGSQGQLSIVDGKAVFEDLTGRRPFVAGDVGYAIRLPYTPRAENFTLPVYAQAGATVNLATETQVSPPLGAANHVGDLTAGLLVDPAFAMIFSQDMAAETGASNEQWFAVLKTGPDAGSRYLIQRYVAANQVVLLAGSTGLPTDGVGLEFVVVRVRYVAVVPEVTQWEIVKENITVADDLIDLSATPTQNVAGVVPYSAYGVRVPIDPTAAVKDPTAGDTDYFVGMPDPHRTAPYRTGRDTGLREEPIQITRV